MPSETEIPVSDGIFNSRNESGKFQSVAVGFYPDFAFGRIVSGKQGFCQRVFDFRLDGAFERTCAVNRVETGFGDDVQCGIGNSQAQVLFSKRFSKPLSWIFAMLRMFA